MIKRPLHPPFSNEVLDQVKDTTIRDKAWPIGKPIMLYNWSGAAYRSPQIDVAVVIVTRVYPIEIYRRHDEVMFYSSDIGGARMLWQREGFQCQAGLDAWFRPLLKHEQIARKFINCFRLLSPAES